MGAWNQAAYQAKLDALTASVRQAAKESLETYSQQAVDLIKRNLNEVSGELMSTVRKEEGRSELSVDVKMGSPEVPYAAALEFGHFDPNKAHGKHVAAHPVFFPAVNVTKKKYRRGLTPKVRKAMKDSIAQSGTNPGE